MEIASALIGAVVGAILGGLVSAYASAQGELRSARRTAYADFQVSVYDHCRDIDQAVASTLEHLDVPPLGQSEPIRHDLERIRMLGPEDVFAVARRLYEHIVAMDTHYARRVPFDSISWIDEREKRDGLRASFTNEAHRATVGIRAFWRSLVN